MASINAKREDRDWSIRLDDGRSINVRYRPMADGGWISIHEDATDLREKRLLIEERISQQSLIDVVPDNLWVKDVESRFVVANRATALRMGHASPQELIGKSDLELCPWETAQKYLADEREVIESGRPMIDSEEYVLAPDGAKVWIATTKAPLRNERGEVVGIIGVSRDVTRRRLADALREGQAEILQMIVGGASAEIVLEELVHLVELQSNGTVVAIVPLDDKGRKLPAGRDVAGGNRSPKRSTPRRTAGRDGSSRRLGHRSRYRLRSRLGGAARTDRRTGTARLLVDPNHVERRRAARRAGGLRPRGARAERSRNPSSLKLRRNRPRSPSDGQRESEGLIPKRLGSRAGRAAPLQRACLRPGLRRRSRPTLAIRRAVPASGPKAQTSDRDPVPVAQNRRGEGPEPSAIFPTSRQEAGNQRRNHGRRRAGRAVVGLDREAEAELRQGGAIDALRPGLDEDARAERRMTSLSNRPSPATIAGFAATAAKMCLAAAARRRPRN